MAALRHVVTTEGLASLWKGNLVTIMHRIPYSSTNFWAYESTKRALEGRVSNDAARAWTAGAVSGLVACTAVSAGRGSAGSRAYLCGDSRHRAWDLGIVRREA